MKRLYGVVLIKRSILRDIKLDNILNLSDSIDEVSIDFDYIFENSNKISKNISTSSKIFKSLNKANRFIESMNPDTSYMLKEPILTGSG